MPGMRTQTGRSKNPQGTGRQEAGEREVTMAKRPAEKLYRIKVVLTWFARADHTKQAIKKLSAAAVSVICPGSQRHITGVEIKRRFRV